MSNDFFFVRVRGRVSGPFDLPGLQKLVRRGQLSRMHEISSDRSSWSAAGEFEDLFPSGSPLKTTSPPEIIPTAPFTNHPEVSEGSTSIAASSDAHQFFYTQRGSTVGPVPLSVLKTLAGNGTLEASDLVWRENADVGVSAAEMPALAPIYGQFSSPRKDGSDQRNDVPGLKSAAAAAQLWGTAAGALMLVLLNVPWLVVDNHPVWWWDLYDAPDAYFAATFITYIVMAAATLCIVGPLTSGVSRGTIYLCITAGVWLLLSASILRAGGNPSDIAPLFVPIALAIIVGTTFFRHAAPQATAGRVLLGICSGVATLGTFVGVVDNLTNRPITALPGGVILGGVLVSLGLLAGLAAGILGFIGLKPSFSFELNKATGVLAAIALVLPGFGIFIAVISLRSHFNSLPSDWNPPATDALAIIVEILLRILLIFYCWLLVLVVGVREALTNAHYRLANH